MRQSTRQVLEIDSVSTFSRSFIHLRRADMRKLG